MLSIFLGALAIFMFGALWFTVLFGRTWAKLMGFDASQDQNGQKMSMVKPLILNFVTNVILASAVYYLNRELITYSFLEFFKTLVVVWLGFSFTIYANAAIWERKSWTLVVINCAQSIIALTIVSGIIYYMS
jgi:hypothetical protein